MTLSRQDWHRRFTQQAGWTSDLREYLYKQVDIEKAHRVLEVGCGTGAILLDLPEPIQLQVGLDVDITYLRLAMRNSARSIYVQGDAHTLPYPEASFDFTLCHFLLLWVADPIQVVREMARVTRPEGSVMAIAEPDYGGRIDYPETLSQLGLWQMASLRQQGADPRIGRKLAHIFHKAGLDFVETGVLGGQWSGEPNWDHWKSEWAILKSDLTEKSSLFNQLDFLKSLDKAAYENNERVLFVPTFYALGRNPSSSR